MTYSNYIFVLVSQEQTTLGANFLYGEDNYDQ